MINETLSELIIREYYGMVYRFCYVMLRGNRQAAEDCTQDTFLTFFSKRSQLNMTDRLPHWLFKTAKRCIKSYLRKHKDIYIRLEDVSETIGQEDAILKMKPDVFDSLTAEEVELLEIYYNNEYGDRVRLAEERGMTIAALYTRVYRIRQKLIEKCRRYQGLANFYYIFDEHNLLNNFMRYAKKEITITAKQNKSGETT